MELELTILGSMLFYEKLPVVLAIDRQVLHQNVLCVDFKNLSDCNGTYPDPTALGMDSQAHIVPPVVSRHYHVEVPAPFVNETLSL